MTSLSKVSEREKLKPRRDPYWQKITKGCYLGFRKMTTSSSGTWTARHFDEIKGKQVYKPIDDASALPEHQRYDAALKEAQAWFEHLGKGGSANVVTLANACENYVAHLVENKGKKTANDAQARFNNYVLNHKRLSATELSKLNPLHLENWRKALRQKPTESGSRRGEVRSDSSLNRDMTSLRAALNLAFRDGHVTSDFAWRSKLRPVKNADQRRDVYLDANQRRKLVQSAADDLKDFLRGLSLVPLRPGALAALTVAHYDRRLNTLTIGKDKSGKDRKITLPDNTAEFFGALCKDKTPAAPLLSRANGKPWDKDAWKKPVKAAVRAAKLPENVTAYALRHSTITDLIFAKVATVTVAQLSGTSVLMIDKHYGHLTSEHARDGLARLTL